MPHPLFHSRPARLREPGTGRLLFAPDPLAEFCTSNGIRADDTLGDEHAACCLIDEWYYLHVVAGGGDPDPVVEEIMAELRHGLDDDGMIYRPRPLLAPLAPIRRQRGRCHSAYHRTAARGSAGTRRSD